MKKTNCPRLQELSGKNFEEKTELLKKWQADGTIDAQTVQEILSKMSYRRNLKAQRLKELKEKDSHTFESLRKYSSNEEFQTALETLLTILRMKHQAYLANRYFNPELTPDEKKALSIVFMQKTTGTFTYLVDDILIETLSFPIKSVRAQGNAFLKEIIQERGIEPAFWIKLLSRQHMAQAQWKQIGLHAKEFAIYGELFPILIKSFVDKGNKDAQIALSTIRYHQTQN